jgi:uncharacterized protein (UPF0262 family)
MNALFSFDLFYGLYTRMLTTAKNYEITHADTAHFGAVVLLLSESRAIINDLYLILHCYVLQIIYTTFFRL